MLDIMSFLGFENKKIVIFGLANKKSVACSIARVLEKGGGRNYSCGPLGATGGNSS